MSEKLKIDGRTYKSAEAEVLAVALSLTKTVLRPKAARDDARQAGTKKRRGSRMPKLDAWLDAQDLNQTNAELFDLLPSPDGDCDLYRDGSAVIEISRAGQEHAITRAGFNKRVTAAVKRRQ